MPIDASIYSRLAGATQGADPNAMINMARNALQFSGESQLGDIYKQSTNPDGTIDAGKLGSLAPQAGVLAPQVAAQAQARAQGQQIIDRNKLDNLREWWKVLDSSIYPLVNKPNLKGQDVLDTVHGLIGHDASVLNGGLFTPQVAIEATKQFYGPNGQMLPPDQIRQKLALFHSRVIDALSNSEYVQSGFNPDGSVQYRTRSGAILNDAMTPRGPAPGNAGGNTGASGATPQPTPGAPQASGNAPSSGPTGGYSSPPPGQIGAAEATGTASGQQLAADRNANANYRREVLPLEQAIPALERLGPNATGPLSDEFNQLKQFLTFVGADKILGVDISKMKDFTEAKKYLTDWVMATGSSGTNDKLAAAFSSNASVHIDQASAVDVAKTALAIRRMKAAQTAEFEKTNLPDSQYTKWAAGWNRSQDSRAYAADLMDPKQLDKLVASLKPAEKVKFLNSLRIAHENELTSPRGGWSNEPQQ